MGQLVAGQVAPHNTHTNGHNASAPSSLMDYTALAVSGVACPPPLPALPVRPDPVLTIAELPLRFTQNVVVWVKM